MSRRATGTYDPSKPLVVEATDAHGTHYRLFLPSGALPASTTVSITPLAASVAPGATDGFGVRIDAAGALLKRRQSSRSPEAAGGAAALRLRDRRLAAGAARHVRGPDSFVVSALGVYAPAVAPLTLRRANVAYRLAQHDFQDAVLEAPSGGASLKTLLAKSGPSLRTTFSAFVQNGCANALDKRGLVVALAIPSVFPKGGKAPKASNVKSAALGCAAQARTAGTGGCQAAETAQDPTARVEARDTYLSWGYRVVKAYDGRTKSFAAEYSRCTGFSFRAVLSFQLRTITLVAYTCRLSVAGDWTGSVVAKPKSKKGAWDGSAASATATSTSRSRPTVRTSPTGAAAMGQAPTTSARSTRARG